MWTYIVGRLWKHEQYYNRGGADSLWETEGAIIPSHDSRLHIAHLADTASLSSYFRMMVHNPALRTNRFPIFRRGTMLLRSRPSDRRPESQDSRRVLPRVVERGGSKTRLDSRTRTVLKPCLRSLGGRAVRLRILGLWDFIEVGLVFETGSAGSTRRIESGRRAGTRFGRPCLPLIFSPGGLISVVSFASSTSITFLFLEWACNFRRTSRSLRLRVVAAFCLHELDKRSSRTVVA